MSSIAVCGVVGSSRDDSGELSRDGSVAVQTGNEIHQGHLVGASASDFVTVLESRSVVPRLLVLRELGLQERRKWAHEIVHVQTKLRASNWTSKAE